MTGKTWPRKIIHMDMDAFFAAVEQRDNPEILGKPVIVGGDPKSRGVVSTASYEARQFGIHSAMPAAQAKRLCPQGIFLRPDFKKYQEVSAQIMETFANYTDAIEAVSLDEAYLDVTQNRLGIDDPVKLAEMIKQNIYARTRLTVSAGVSFNMFLAKIASDYKKPNGLTVISPERAPEFLETLAVRKIPGVGPKTEKILLSMGITTCGELQGRSRRELRDLLGKHGLSLYEKALGRDERTVEPDAEPAQLSTEETFARDCLDVNSLKFKLSKFAEEIVDGLHRRKKLGLTVQLKVKYFDFELITRSKTLDAPPRQPEDLAHVAFELLEKKTLAGKKPIRLIGLGITGLRDEEDFSSAQQGELF